MKTQDAIKHFRTKTAIASALGISLPAVSQWGDEVPTKRRAKLAELSGGKLDAGARNEAIR